MSQLVSRTVRSSFRKSFRTPNNDALQWFPGHMGKGMKQMEQQLKNVDCIIEVHDARIPLSGRNPIFQRTILGMKPHILVLNKKDLTDMNKKKYVTDKLAQEHGVRNVIFTNCRDRRCGGISKVIPTAVDLINSSERFNRADSQEFCVMVIGVPNVGKSSLINILRNKYLKKGKAAPVGAEAGMTRSLQTRIKVLPDPPTYLLDTPGILTPSVRNAEAGMRLALCASLQDHLVGATLIADYLLYWLNKNENFKYVSVMGVDEPTDKIGLVLTKSAIKLSKFLKFKTHEGYVNKPDLEMAALHFIRAFREGQFGPVMLDYDL